ncbi:MAG: protein-tyrosine-phosphatase [Phycisphaeraceae bacterium]|nr:MAG: protein-tyrosine-phosphatase [Phycisphaeraceae bacterium]
MPVPIEAAKLSGLSAGERDKVVARAAEALAAGELVVLPTDTVYGVFAAANDAGAVRALRAAWDLADDAGPEGPMFYWHAPDGDAVRSMLNLPTPVARRLADRFMPGPVRFEIEQPAATLTKLRTTLGVAPGVIDAGGVLTVRVPEHEACAEVLTKAGVPTVALGIGLARWSSPDAGRTVGEPPTGTGEGLPAIVVDDGPTLHGKPSTLIRLFMDGRFEVGAGGVLDEAGVLSALERVILFVCTGNTCRSPMAEAIARKLIGEKTYAGVTTRVASAGVAAGPGVHASDDAVRVMGAMGIDLDEHRSRPITRAMIGEAEIIYTMTPSHAQAVMTMLPEAAEKVFPLDPRGVVEDPVGMGRDVYKRTAAQLEQLIRQRLEELDR